MAAGIDVPAASSLSSGGRQLTSGTGCVSGDGRLLLLPAGSTIRACAAATGETLAKFSGRHSAQVTAVVRDPRSATQVYSASLDGTVKLWDLHEGVVLKSITVGAPVASLVVPSAGSVAFVTCDWRSASAGRVYRLDLKSGKPLEANTKVSKANRLATSADGTLVSTFDRHTLFVWKTHQAHMDPLALHHTKRFTCSALAPSGSVVAAGDESGRITMWHNLESAMHESPYSEVKTSVSTVHWHSAPVGSVCFSADGNHLLSGGLEAVLVIWQLSSGKRNYLPRLGGALVSISDSPDPVNYLVAQSDNTVRLINISSMRVDASIYGMLPPPKTASLPEAAAVLEPGTGNLAIPASNAVLQFYDVVHDRHVANLQVASRNYVSLTVVKDGAGADTGLPEEPRVSHLAFIGNGDWLATVQMSPSLGAGHSEYSLKFWERVADSVQSSKGSRRSYVLNTEASAPHDSDVLCLAHHPHKCIVLTGTSSGEFKMWARHAVPKSPNDTAPGSASKWAWRCRSAGDMADTFGIAGGGVTAAAFSGDGSLLAMASGSSVSLWEPETNTKVAQLPAPVGGRTPIRQLSFIRGSHFLVGASAGSGGSGGGVLVVWNLLTLSVWWSYKMMAKHLVADPSAPRFALTVRSTPQQKASGGDGGAVAGGERLVLLFDPMQPYPVAAWRLKTPAPSALLFAPPGSDMAMRFKGVAGAAPLLLVDQSREYVVLGHPVANAPAFQSPTVPQPFENGSAVDSLFGAVNAPTPLVADVMQEDFRVEGSKATLDSLLNVPSHALPSVAELCPAFLEMVVSGLVPSNETL
eukprot:CAMPEP_0177794212 /NCGR_PEP_ID=MMETSP0491_2-20121128/25517_1 /TAXON_ID=63592 /ORGANISM="Tetraselmis chuii, Strain PLY429" /LENGTH=807 /DNA_ID=CAMNT_0019316837 /DNA_START=58 /DNA_END=2481 /DNA_ORIENTATION=+